MEPENIDWNNIDSVFIEDDTYENINAPKWVDLSALAHPFDDVAWFRNPDCKHPKKAEDYHTLRRYPKVRFLRSVSISEILPFRDRTCRYTKSKNGEIKSSSVAEIPNQQSFKVSNFASNSNEDFENRNPNISTPSTTAKTRSSAAKSSREMKKQGDNSVKHDRKPSLRSTFSARNLLAGREVLNKITGLCTELKKLGKKDSKKTSSEKVSSGVLGELREKTGERERMPLLVKEEVLKAIAQR